MDKNKSNKTVRLILCRAAAISILITIALSLLTCKTSPPKRNILLITIDTLRADRLGCYGSRSVYTPNIDALAASGTLFEETTSPTPLTLPSHASILTGRYPTEHGIRDNGFYRLPEGYPNLASNLSERGYRTAAFVASGTLNSLFGLNQGFDIYDDMSNTKGFASVTDRSERSADEVNSKVIEWLKSGVKEPFFLWVHYFEPHSPYHPPDDYLKQYSSRLYDGEVAYTDQEIGKLLRAIKKSGFDKNTLKIFTADHGEALGEHGEPTHGIFLYRPTMHVPLIISGPKVPKGKRISTLTRLIDIYPTIFSYLMMSDVAETSGRDLSPIIFGKIIPEEESAYIETEGPLNLMGWSMLKGVRTDRYKYIAAPARELYDLKNDPTETFNIITSHAEVAAKMRKEMKRIEATFPGKNNRPTSSIFPDHSTRKNLESLGYVGNKTSPRAGKSLANPADMVKVLELYHRGKKVYLKKDYIKVVEIYSKALALDPENTRLLQYLAYCQHQIARFKEASKNYEKLLTLDPRLVTAWSDLGYVYAQMGQFDKAVEYAKKAIRLDPKGVEAYYTLGAIYEKQGSRKEAVEQYRRTLEINPDHINTLNQLGRILAADPATADEGHKLLEKARAINNK